MKKVLMNVGGFSVSVLVLVVIVASVSGCSGKKLACKATDPKASITISYNDKGITGYKALGLDYDLEGQKAYAQEVGVEAYMAEFTEWFESATNGTCSN